VEVWIKETKTSQLYRSYHHLHPCYLKWKSAYFLHQ